MGLYDSKYINTCPYCFSKKIDFIYDIDMPTMLHACQPEEAIRSRCYKIKVALCEECGLGFNASPLSDEDIESIYKNYRYIKPRKNIGISKYGKIIEMISRNVMSDQSLVEIGSSDGFLIDTLVGKGYSRVEGFEPSQEWRHMQNQNCIRNEFFTERSSFVGKIDLFFLMHVLEHFSNPWKILMTMMGKLSDEGKIVFEVPNFSGVHHQHLIYFSPVFVHRLAKDMGLNILEEEVDNEVLRVCLKKTKGKESDIDRSDESISSLVDKLKKRQAENQEDLDRLKHSIAMVDNVFWWGTGSTSIITLSALGESVCKGKVFTFIDSDEERSGLTLPISFLDGTKIELPAVACPKMGPDDLLVIASMFSNEIVGAIKDGGYVVPLNVFSCIRTI